MIRISKRARYVERIGVERDQVERDVYCAGLAPGWLYSIALWNHGCASI